MTLNQLIASPILEYQVPGLELQYDGWRDKVTGRVRAEHSNRQEMRWYSFRCGWKDGKVVIEDFAIAARSLDPDNRVKGTATSNRQDVKSLIQDRADKWRRLKLKEQEVLRAAVESGRLIRLEAVSEMPRRLCIGWYAPDAILFEPAACGSVCRGVWIEALNVGRVDPEVARFVFDWWLNCTDAEGLIEAVREGLGVADLKERFSGDR